MRILSIGKMQMFIQDIKEEAGRNTRFAVAIK
jgi:hypothetical protein